MGGDSVTGGVPAQPAAKAGAATPDGEQSQAVATDGDAGAPTSASRSRSVWVVCVPDYDNYEFDLYATREAALAAIKAQMGDEIGDWSETFEGRQIEFQGRTPNRRLLTRKQIWSLEEAEVHV